MFGRLSIGIINTFNRNKNRRTELIFCVFFLFMMDILLQTSNINTKIRYKGFVNMKRLYNGKGKPFMQITMNWNTMCALARKSELTLKRSSEEIRPRQQDKIHRF